MMTPSWLTTLPTIALVVIGFTLAATENRPAERAPDEQSLPRYEPRFGRSRPVIAVLGYNAATEVTDYVVPYGILAESGVADLIALATGPGPIEMRPALRFQAQATVAEFEARYPEGADYVVVPNVYEGATDRMLLEWIRSQSRRGAIIVGICDGVPVLANALAAKLGVEQWSPVHDSEQFRLGGKLFTALRNKAFFWQHEELGVNVATGVDEIALALTADAYSRTRRSWAFSVVASPGPVPTRRGLTLLPDRQAGAGQPSTMLPSTDHLPPAQALDAALQGIDDRYGERTAAFVAVQIEYPWSQRIADVPTETAMGNMEP